MLQISILLATVLSANLTLAPAVWAQQEDPGENPARQETEPQEPAESEARKQDPAHPAQEGKPSAEEIKAVEAWRELQGKFEGPAERTRKSFEKYMDQLFTAMTAFAKEFDGTAASLEARHEMALMEIHARQNVDRGLQLMAGIFEDCKKYKGVSPEGMRLDVKHYLFVYALALSDQDRYDQAEKLLEPLAKVQSVEGDQARGLLSRIKMGRNLRIGRPMPDFTGWRLRNGKKFSLSEFKGQVVLVQFWATWSRPCMQEMPFIIESYQALHDLGFNIIGIALDDDRREGRQRLQTYTLEQKMIWPQLYDGKAWESALAQQFQIRSIPASFLLDRKGIIRQRDLRGREMMDAVKALLAE
jgi:peroxiredoxin